MSARKEREQKEFRDHMLERALEFTRGNPHDAVNALFGLALAILLAGYNGSKEATAHHLERLMKGVVDELRDDHPDDRDFRTLQ